MPHEVESMDEAHERVQRINRRAGVAACLLIAALVVGIAGCQIERAGSPAVPDAVAAQASPILSEGLDHALAACSSAAKRELGIARSQAFQAAVANIGYVSLVNKIESTQQAIEAGRYNQVQKEFAILRDTCFAIEMLG